MDEQTSPTPESPVITPDPIVTDSLVVEPPQAGAAQAPGEPVAAPEIPQLEQPSEPLAVTPETGTAQMGRNEPLRESEITAKPSVDVTAETPQPETQAAEPVTLPSPQTPAGSAQPEATQSPTSSASAQSAPPPAQPEVAASHPEPAPAKVNPAPASLGRLILQKASAIIQRNKRRKIEKIMALFLKKKSITNDDVEKLLHVSDATATRYLAQLEKENRIMQTGKTGQGVTYTKR